MQGTVFRTCAPYWFNPKQRRAHSSDNQLVVVKEHLVDQSSSKVASLYYGVMLEKAGACNACGSTDELSQALSM
eukprot:1160948-Pelagomonas_calceolata.AAC.10